MSYDEPPDDPYDNQPPPRPQHADRAAERALLATLLDTPTTAETLTTEVDADDFNWPEHATIWNTWHALNNGTPPDPVTLNNALLKDRNTPAVHALADITLTTPNPTHAGHYARIIRDHARLRTLDNTAARLSDLARRSNPDTIDRTLGDALQALEDAAMRYGPRNLQTLSGFRDLSWILTGQTPVIPPPVWVQHDAGHALFYAGKVNGVFGDPETAKTWLAQCAVVEALNTPGGTAAMVDVDHNGENHTAARLLLLGAHPEAIADPDRFRYYDPQDGDELRHAITDITTRTPDVVLVDSLGEIFPMLGLNTNDGDEVTGGLRLISQPAAGGSCVIFIDHLPKATEARASGFAIGSIAKKRAVRGSYIRAEERTKPAPGQIGRISLFVEKDTSGELRRALPGGKFVGTFVLDSTQPHVTTWRVQRDDIPTDADGNLRPTHLMEAVSRHIELNDQCTFRDIKDAVSGKDKWLRSAIKHLIEEGFVSVHHGARNAQRHHSIALYREAEDDHLNTTN